MFLSIVIPHYNIEQQLLERCIESIRNLGLTEDRYEIIVIDDGSHTPPRWVEEKYPQEHIRLICAEHGGPGAARNRGIYEAKGKYIQFVDADDYLLTGEGIHKCINTLQREKPQILRFKYTVCTGSCATQPNTPVKFGNTISGATYMSNNNLSGSPCIYFLERELVIKKNISFPENNLHEDEEFNTILDYHAQTLIESNATLYAYCTRKDSTTTNKSPEFKEKRIEHLLSVIKRLKHFKDSVSSSSNIIQEKALQRKITMLCVDAILNMLYAGFNAERILTTCRDILAPLNLYPLPKSGYSLKYRTFSTLANNKTGLSILRLITPKKKPQQK